LTNKFEETPNTFDEYSYYDYSRKTIADFRPDAPTQESEMPRDTRPRSQASLNLRLHGSLSSADPANHPEMFMGFLDQDTRVAGDGNVPIGKIQEQMRKRGARYLKPTEPHDTTHLTEAITEGIEPETRYYTKLQEARARMRKNLRTFGRSIENPGSASVMGWCQPHAPSASQTSEGGAGSITHADTSMRAQIRAEFAVDEKNARSPTTANVLSGNGEASTLAALHACAIAPGGGASELIRAVDHTVRPINRYGSIESVRADRAARYKLSGPSEPHADIGISQISRGGPSLGALAFDMAKCARQSGSDIEKARDDPRLRILAAQRPTGQGAASLIISSSTSDVRKQQEIFTPTMRVAGTRERPGAAMTIDGGNIRALHDEMEGNNAYMYIDAALMRLACRAQGTQVEDIIRRKMITDARAPTDAERTLANKLLQQAKFRGFSVEAIARTTTRDIESGADNATTHNAHMPNITDGPTAWRTAQAALCETQLVSAPEVQSAPTHNMSHTAVAPSTTPLHYMVQSAVRNETNTRRFDDEIADILAPSDGVITTGSARVIPRAASHKSVFIRENLGDDIIAD
jgi:hypothetical protein